MAKPQFKIRGNKQETDTFTEVNSHYDTAKQDLETRIKDFDKKDELFRSHIKESGWPYQSQIFDPRVFTAIFEKTSRLFANKPKGRMVPREGGDSLGAKINNELLSFQWDENERVDNLPMIAKWAQMDMNTRKYGASFALCKWQYKRKLSTKDGETKSVPFFDGPDFKTLINRDCLPNPSYSTIKNWFQHRDYVTVQELKTVNDAARSKPVYKNLDLLLQSIKENENFKGDTREANWTSKNKSIKGLTDYLGTDEYFKTVEIITEYREERWISFAPKHGVVIRDIPNPYEHGQIPIVMLRYYPIDDDIYGLSEIESVEKLQRGINALICQYVDAINMSLYAPLKIRATGVQMHTIEFGPGKKWIMNDPSTDVVTHDQSLNGVSEFTSTYRFLVGAMQEALGETSAAVSNLNPGDSSKTATEIKDLTISRNARDNFNQIFLSEALKKQMMFWHTMNRQMLFSNPTQKTKIIKIVGKDAIAYFQKRGLDGLTLDERGTEIINSEIGEELLAEKQLFPEDLGQEMYPVDVNGETLPKFSMEDGEVGNLILEPEDLAGNYDYIPDVESMQLPDKNQILTSKMKLIELATNPQIAQGLMVEQYKIKLKDLLEDTFEDMGAKDADKYFEKIEGGLNGINQAGGINPQAGGPGMPGLENGGMAAGNQAMAQPQA